jgi:hypothetical protein
VTRRKRLLDGGDKTATCRLSMMSSTTSAVLLALVSLQGL